MTAAKSWTLWCDAPQCHQWYSGGETTAKRCREAARGWGWVSLAHGDYCGRTHMPAIVAP